MKILGNASTGLSRFPIARWAPIPLRLIVGYGFMEHGFAKLSNGVDAFAAILRAIGVPDPHLMALLTILTELFGGFAVILGAFVPIVSLPMAAVLLTAMFTVHLPYGFSSIKLIAVTAAGPKFGPPGYEVALLYIACLAALVIGGSGPFAVDGFIGRALSNHLRHSKFVAPRDDQVMGDVGCEKVAPSASEIRARSVQQDPTPVRELIWSITRPQP